MTGDLTLWTLVHLQIAMGAFDTLYHHEFTERLAWRDNAAKELGLHAVRNGFYAALFLVLAWSEPHGLVAALVLGVLLIEVLVTLWDFVEEDMTRRLPASERVTHTLLALNYGAILLLLVPRLWAWLALPTGFAGVSHGLGSLVLTISALGVVLFGLRDWHASRRQRRLSDRPAALLAQALPGRRRILITGATGFIGERLGAALAAAGHDVIALVRSPEKGARLRAPVTLITSLDQLPASTRLDCIVQLAGAPVADWPWTRANRFRILQSRLKMARRVLALIDRLDARPEVLIAASAIGWYGAADDQPLSDSAPSGAGFAALVCRMIESEALRAACRGVRVVNLRIGLVLDRAGGPLARLLPPFDLGLGGQIGHGRQWMSWISRDDLIRLIAHVLATPELRDAVNATAPNPVRNSEFAQTLGRTLWRPALLPLPAWPLRLVLGQMGQEMLLSGARVLPEKAQASGFRFEDPTLEQALARNLGCAIAVQVAPSTTGTHGARRALTSPPFWSKCVWGGRAQR